MNNELEYFNKGFRHCKVGKLELMVRGDGDNLTVMKKDSNGNYQYWREYWMVEDYESPQHTIQLIRRRYGI